MNGELLQTADGKIVRAVVCPVCGALVRSAYLEIHNVWHRRIEGTR
jgi:hypothetical protein